MQDAKTKEQELVKSEFRKRNYTGTYLGATGCGKTKIGIDLLVEYMKMYPNEKWIIIVPTENLRDNEWKNEFIRWGYGQFLDKVQIECIQTAYKISGQTLNAIVDEVHTTVSQEYKMFYENNTIKKLMCFTATIDDQDKRDYITKMAPIVWITDLNRARKLGIIAPYYIFNLGLAMSADTAQEYSNICSQYAIYETALGGPIRAFANAGYIMKTMKDIPKEDRTAEQKALLRKAKIFWSYMQRRKTFLYNCPEKITATQEILQAFPDRKALVFSETISFAEKINSILPHESVLFHSKMNKTERKEALKKFDIASNSIRVISAVKALNAGFNVPECSLGICAAGSSKWLDMIQRQGRISRLQEDKIAIFVNLYMIDTQDVKWVRARTRTIHPNYVKWITNIQQIQV